MNRSKEEALFKPHKVGSVALPSRIVMAPMTRSRTTQPGNIPNDLMAQYYRQRASAALIVTEATQISPQGQGYSFTPGIHSKEQVAGWKLVTDAVHAEGGKIFLQLWHVGRMSHTIFHGGQAPVAPSALAPGAKVWIADETGKGSMQDCPVPRELKTEEIRAIVEDYGTAAKNALAAGFDGVEIHGGNGYLIDEFLRTSSNKRTDEYGGSVENRLRFPLEVIRKVAEVVGPERVGLRLSPHNTARGMNCPEIIDTSLILARELDKMGVAYLHFAEADWDDAPVIPREYRVAVRKAYKGTVIVAGRYDQARAEQVVDEGLADLVAFGRAFLANPDLPQRLKEHLPLNEGDKDTFFGGDEHGYTDYPRYGR